MRAELFIAAGATRWNEYLSVGNQLVGVRFLDINTEVVTLRYFQTDHLGSVAVITNEAGAVVERFSGACPPAGEAGPEGRLGQAPPSQWRRRSGRRHHHAAKAFRRDRSVST